ncbi:MAG: glycine cleavage system protein H [Syntrophales bacterium]|jgi:glycine cleavage system H protein|nr:glycine cleavage system protein H [Syntrophales bacterium]MCK9527496.1 glycine cleavage system protein H [Syntrophales bacterium]MDX9922552.1 glycine cleavage system H protein [Syntrophales bacterium]
MSYPDDLLYSRDHTWARVDDTIVTIGITDFAQESLGEILSIDLHPVDSPVKQGEPFGVIETDKTTAELISPVSGDIIGINEDIFDDVGVLECDVYDAGWLISVEIDDLGELDSLLDADDYEELVDQALGRR